MKCTRHKDNMHGQYRAIETKIKSLEKRITFYKCKEW